MDTSGDQGQASTSLVQQIPAPSEPNLAISWASAFQSLEFMLGLQTAVLHVLCQYNAPTNRVAQLELLGNPTQMATNLPARNEGQVGDSSLHCNPGTFVAPLFINSGSSSAQESHGITSVNTALGGSNSNKLASELPSAPSQSGSAESAFILGPGRAPIPAKIVKRIISHEFVEMSELMPKNLDELQAETPVFIFVGSMVVPKLNSAKKSAVIDILTWVECFNSYIALLTTFYPPRSHDLLAYMALIVRTAKRFTGTAWLDYDRAFRREAPTRNLRDWSVMRPDLYNYHTALISVNQLSSNKREANQSPQRNFISGISFHV